jgi:hypothetical protein
MQGNGLYYQWYCVCGIAGVKETQDWWRHQLCWRYVLRPVIPSAQLSCWLGFSWAPGTGKNCTQLYYWLGFSWLLGIGKKNQLNCRLGFSRGLGKTQLTITALNIPQHSSRWCVGWWGRTFSCQGIFYLLHAEDNCAIIFLSKKDKKNVLICETCHFSFFPRSIFVCWK